jgi:hypothetical protein
VDGGMVWGCGLDSRNAESKLHSDMSPSLSSAIWPAAALPPSPPGHLADHLAAGTATFAWLAVRAGVGL